MLSKNDFHQMILTLIKQVENTLSKRIEQYGRNERADNKNTLKGSNLEKSIKVKPLEGSDYGIALEIADYWEYVALGWEHTGRSSVRGLYHELVLWALRKRIKLDNYTQNESAVIVAERVWMQMIFNNRPIKARPFMEHNEKGYMDEMIPSLKDYMDEWCYNLFEAIINDIDKFFS